MVEDRVIEPVVEQPPAQALPRSHDLGLCRPVFDGVVEAFDLRVPVEVGHFGKDVVGRVEESRDLEGAGVPVHQVEGAEQRPVAVRVGANEKERHRRPRLVGVGVDGDPVQARMRDREAVPVAPEIAGREGPAGVVVVLIDEHRDGVVELLADALAGHAVRSRVARIVDQVRRARRPPAQPDRRIERTIGRLQVAAQVERRDPLLGRQRVEPGGGALGRQQPRQVLLDQEQVLEGVLVLEPRQTARRRLSGGSSRHVRRLQISLQRGERRVDDSPRGSPRPGRRHLACLETLEDPHPLPEGPPILQVVAEVLEIERRLGLDVVAAKTRDAEEARDVGLDRAGESRARQDTEHRKEGGRRCVHHRLSAGSR